LSFPHALVEKLAAAWPLARWRDVTVLVAVSGGADSVALLRGLIALRDRDHEAAAAKPTGRMVVAHFNHRLRGAESDGDEAFVRELAEELKLPAVVGVAEMDLAAAGGGEGVEGAARQARYDFLARAAGECGARYVATAHTADDQAETVLFNVLRGTGLAGLAGIPRVRRLTDAATIVRPLLDVTRAEVLDYLRAIGQPYREDSSNLQEDYTRNRLRRKLLPQLEAEYNPRCGEALLRISEIARQATDFFEQEAQTVLGMAAQLIAGGVELNLEDMAQFHPAVIQQAVSILWQTQGWPLQDMSHEKWQRLVEWCQAGSSVAPRVEIFPGGVRAEVTAGMLRLTLPPRQR
jgi:tRNA(Ile)-lysidine synthase